MSLRKCLGLGLGLSIAIAQAQAQFPGQVQVDQFGHILPQYLPFGTGPGQVTQGNDPRVVTPGPVVLPEAQGTPQASLFASFTSQYYAAAVAGGLAPGAAPAPLLYPGTSGQVIQTVGSQDGFYISGTGLALQIPPRAARFTSSPVSGKPQGLFQEGVFSNIATISNTWVTGGACTASQSLSSISTAVPPLFPGYVVIRLLRDSSASSSLPHLQCTINPSQSYSLSGWVMVPGLPIVGDPGITVPSQATSLCVTTFGTGVSNSKVCSNLDRTGTWQWLSVNVGTTTGATNTDLTFDLEGPPGSIAYATGLSFASGTMPSSTIPVSTGLTGESVQSTGAGLEGLGGGSGTLVWSGTYYAASQTTGTVSSGLQATDNVIGSAGNTISLEVVGSATQPTLQMMAVAGGTTVATIPGGAPFPNQPFTAGVSWGPGGYTYADSMGGYGSASGAIPTGLKGLIGLQGPNPHRQWKFYPQSMSGQQLATLVGSGMFVTATVSPNPALPKVPVDFVGISWEANTLAGNTFVNTQAVSLGHLLGLLGQGRARIGGNTSDASGFAPTQAQVNGFAAFLQGIGWTGLSGTNFCSGSISAQTTTAGFYAAAGIEIQLGNEPDLFGPTTCVPLAPATNQWGPSNYLADWGPIYSSVIAASPGAKVAGPDVGTLDSWLLPFSAGTTGEISELTRHYYALCNQLPDTVPNLLGTDTLYPIIAAPRDAALAQSLGLRIRMTETNSRCAGGISGISDVFASSTWGVEYMMQLAALGFAGVNYHSDGSAPNGIYTPIILQSNQLWNFRPLGYAMLLFSKVQGMQQEGVTESVPFTTAPVGAYLDTIGRTWVIAVNKNLTQPEALTINSPGNWSVQSVETLTYANGATPTTPAPTAPNQVTFGGASVTDQSTWSGVATPTPRGTPISIPAASSVLVLLQ